MDPRTGSPLLCRMVRDSLFVWLMSRVHSPSPPE